LTKVSLLTHLHLSRRGQQDHRVGTKALATPHPVESVELAELGVARFSSDHHVDERTSADWEVPAHGERRAHRLGPDRVELEPRLRTITRTAWFRTAPNWGAGAPRSWTWVEGKRIGNDRQFA
jgi:hypothetical protein